MLKPPTRYVFSMASSSIQLTISAGAISEKCQGGDFCHGMGPCGDAPGYFLWAREPTSCFVKFMRISMEIWQIYLLEIFIGDIQLLIISNNNI
jgi:hypothetical protein